MDSKEQYEQLKNELSKLRTQISALRAKANNTTFHDEARGIEAVNFSNRTIHCRRTLKGHLSKVVDAQWFTAGTNPYESIVSASPDGKLLVWDPMSAMKTGSINLSCLWITCCCASSDGSLLASGSLDNTCSIHSLKEKKPEITVLSGHDAYISRCAFLNGSKNILTTSGDHTSILWDVSKAASITKFEGHMAEVLNTCVSSNEKQFVTCSIDKSSKLWDVRTGKCEKTCEGHEKDVNACKFFPNDLFFASVSDDCTCKLFDLRSDQFITTYSRSLISSPATSLCFSSSGRLLFVGYDDFKCRIWDTLKSSKVVSSLSHAGRVSCIERSSTGNAILTGAWDGQLKIWN